MTDDTPADHTPTTEIPTDRTHAIVCEPHDWDGARSLSETLIIALAEHADDVTATSKPLYTVIDPEALDALFRQTNSGISRTGGTVSFTYTDYTIFVEATGEFAIFPTDVLTE